MIQIETTEGLTVFLNPACIVSVASTPVGTRVCMVNGEVFGTRENAADVATMILFATEKHFTIGDPGNGQAPDVNDDTTTERQANAWLYPDVRERGN